MDKKQLKVVVIGDSGVGRTCLLKAYTLGHWPNAEDLEGSSVFDNYNVIVTFEPGEIAGIDVPQTVEFQFWDVSGSEEYAQLRTLNYPETNVFMVCFNLADRTSLEHIKTVWVPEIAEHGQGAPFLAVGLNQDTRDKNLGASGGDKKKGKKDKKDKKGKGAADDAAAAGSSDVIDFDEGEAFCVGQCGALQYRECSAQTQEGLKEVFAAVAEVHELHSNPLLAGALKGASLSKKEKKTLEKQEKARRKSVAQSQRKRK